MDFERKYALIEPIPGQGANSYRGRQLATGRDVTVHLLRGDRAENETLLSRVRTLPPEYLGQVIEVGEQEGTFYLVTAPPHRHFSEWLPEQERFTSPEPGEFTRFFQPNSLPANHSSQPALDPVVNNSGPGEFTRLFSPAIPSTPTDEHQFNPPAPSQAPGEYTRVIAQSLLSSGPRPDETPSGPPPASIHQTAEVKRAPSARRMVSAIAAALLCLVSFLAGATLVFLMVRH